MILLIHFLLSMMMDDLLTHLIQVLVGILILRWRMFEEMMVYGG